jgi:hypothetical protein
MFAPQHAHLNDIGIYKIDELQSKQCNFSEWHCRCNSSRVQCKENGQVQGCGLPLLDVPHIPQLDELAVSVFV